MKAKLLHLIKESRAKEETILVPHIDDREPSESDKWTTKDQVAHMVSWREIATAELNAVRTGSEPPEISGDDDVENAQFYARTHGLPARTIIESASRSWDALTASVEASSEEDLQKPRPRDGATALWFVVAINTYDHVAEHLGYWYSDQGDEQSAEKAAIWCYDIGIATFTEDRRVGAAEYNLGSFYAKRGRAAEALPRLTRGLELRPDLREYAKKDHNLDPIRSNGEVARLLG